MIKRLHIPGFEHAYPYFDEAISEGIIDGSSGHNYTQYTINAVLEWQKGRP